MKRLLAFLLLVLAVFPAQSSPPVSLQLSSYRALTPVQVYLNEDDRLWLKQRKALNVAVWQYGQSPLMQSTVSGRYKGMNADYLALIQHALNVRINVTAYADEQSAMAALQAGKEDTVLTGLMLQPKAFSGFLYSAPLARAWPTLVTKLTNVMAPLQSAQSLSIARVNGYPDDDFIHTAFPNAEIRDYADYQAALSSVANEQNAYFIGDSLMTSSWLSQEFSLELTAVRYWSGPQKASQFVFSPALPRLRNIFNNVLTAIDESVHTQIAQSVIDKGNLSFLIEPLDLTVAEKKWLEKNRTLKVIVNPWFAPYTLLDSNQEVRGVVGDILNLVALQTGIQYQTVAVRSHDELLREIQKGGWHIVQAATYDLSGGNDIVYTHPFITTRFVTVVRKEETGNPLLRSGATVAISSEHTLLNSLRQKYPGVHWQQVENSSVAVNLVATGKADAAISNQLTARYLSEHYYPDELTWQSLTDESPASISFAVPRGAPELRSILDKALDDIPQKEISQIVSKWIRLPDVKIDTWELYNRPFYLVVALATLLVLSSLLWAVYLAKEVRQRKRSEALLEEERNKAQNANQEKREFLARMSHEIRTPVSAIVGFLELLQRSSSHLRAADNVAVDHATSASHSLLKLIGEVLDLEKIESGLQEITPQWTDVDALVRLTIAQFSALAGRKGTQLSYTSKLASSEAAWVDSQLLGQVLTNVIGNAVKFTQRGAVTLTVEVENGVLQLLVRDSGAGISPEDQARLFSAFSQGAAGEHIGGSGLGLTISKALMLQMGGDIELQSAPGQGTTVTLRLPVQTSLDEKPVQPERPALSAAPDPMLKVLIADDHPTSRQLLHSQLAELGLTADEAYNGQEAFGLIAQQAYDLLITDLNMPVMDGIALTQHLRKAGRTLVICGLTATAQEHERQRCLAAGMDHCLFKPVSLLQLSALLAETSPAPRPVVDKEKLSVLARGNRELMRRALEEAQQENRRDVAQAKEGALLADRQKVAWHVHRLLGTAQLLGAAKLAETTQRLENSLPDAIATEDLLSELARIDVLLSEIDNSVQEIAS